MMTKAQKRPYYNDRRWHELRRRKVATSNGRCTECGNVGHLELHHTQKDALTPENFFDDATTTLLCPSCHHVEDHARKHGLREWNHELFTNVKKERSRHDQARKNQRVV